MSETEERDELDRCDMSDLAGGNDLALNRLMNRHSECVVHFLMRVLGDRQEALDLAMEAFVRVYEHRKRFKPDAKFTTWLYAISSNLAKDRLRWRKRHPSTPFSSLGEGEQTSVQERVEASSATPMQLMEKREEVELVRRAISSLPDDLRLPIILTEYEGYTHLEAANVLGCSAKAVEMRVYRAKKALKEVLREHF